MHLARCDTTDASDGIVEIKHSTQSLLEDARKRQSVIERIHGIAR